MIKEWGEGEGKTVATEAFRAYDLDEDKVLNREEAAKFFTDLVPSAVNMLDSFQKQQHGDSNRTPLLGQQVVDAYMAAKSERDASAFSVVDKNSDGKIDLAEFLAIFADDKHYG